MTKYVLGVEFDHAEGAILDYGFDWADWLAVGESVTASTWSTDDTTILLENDGISGDITTTFVNGGDAGVTAVITNEITTSDGRTDSRSITLNIKVR